MQRVHVEPYNQRRPHRALDFQPPQPAEPPPTPTVGEIHRHDRLGGLIHEYYTVDGAVSNHAAGRAMDIGGADGEICRGMRTGGCADLVREIAAVEGPLRSTELIYCWDPDGLADPRGFARADHWGVDLGGNGAAGGGGVPSSKRWRGDRRGRRIVSSSFATNWRDDGNAARSGGLPHRQRLPRRR